MTAHPAQASMDGLSAFFMLSSTMPESLAKELNYYAVGGCGGNIAWHTENDLLEIADPEVMLRDIKIYLAAAWKLANAEVFPFDWRAATASLKDALGRYQAAVKEGFSFTPSFTALEELNAALDGLYAGIACGKIKAEAANSTIKKLARILVPLDHSAEPRFLHDPALPRPAIPLLSLANRLPLLPDEEARFARVDLTRNQNRVVEALNAATEVARIYEAR
jgi:N-acetylated-alpha-linked acidic dipeptidase